MARTVVSLVATLTAAVLVAGCGGSNSSEQSGNDLSDGDPGGAAGVPHETGLIGVEEPKGEAQEGGTLSIGVYAEARGLDPIVAPSSGVLGGMEMAAIYDVLVRYNPATGEFGPWMAASLEHNSDYTVWTLGLREGVHFSDGTSLNADAVVFGFERAQDGRYSEMANQIAEMETPNDYTVVFRLKEPWSRFAYLLSVGPGRVASPTAVRKYGEDFAANPIGAGPFVLDHFSPGEEMVLTTNQEYWGDGPYLEKLRFVPLNGAQAKLDALKAGGLQGAFLRNAGVIASARKAGYGGFVNVVSAGEVLAINRNEGRPGSDLRVRKAIAHAINIEQLNQRVYDGKGLSQKEVMAASSRWATKAEATPYNVEMAEELLAQAKASGFDGKLSISTNTAPTRQDAALTLQAQLNAVGFDISIDTVPSAGALFGKVLEGSYDLAFYGISITDAAPWVKLYSELNNAVSTVDNPYDNSDMWPLLNDLHDATSEEAKRTALNGIQREWTETVPMVSLAAIPEFTAFSGQVHGIVPTAYSTVLFGQTWLGD